MKNWLASQGALPPGRLSNTVSKFCGPCKPCGGRVGVGVLVAVGIVVGVGVMLGVRVKVSEGVTLGGTSVGAPVGAKAVRGGGSKEGCDVADGTSVEVG